MGTTATWVGGQMMVHVEFSTMISGEDVCCSGVLCVLFAADIANPDLFACVCWIWICLDIVHFYEDPLSMSLLGFGMGIMLLLKIITNIYSPFCQSICCGILVTQLNSQLFNLAVKCLKCGYPTHKLFYI